MPNFSSAANNWLAFCETGELLRPWI